MEKYLEFVSAWDFYMLIGTIIFVGLAASVFIYHEIKVASKKEYKEKYDYVILNEIKFFVYSVKLSVVAVCFASNMVMTEWIVYKGWDWFLGRFFLTICVAILFYVLLSKKDQLQSQE